MATIAHAPGPWQTARVMRIAALTPRLKSFDLKPAAPFGWLPGQHVEIRLSAPDGYQARRSYSIASDPASGTLELAIERLDDGEVSPFFHDVVVVGDEIELRGPIGGHFVWQADDGALLAIGGGSGVVPLVAMIRNRARRAGAPPAVLMVSARTWDEVPFRDELIALESTGSGLSVVFALTRDVARRPQDYARRIDAAMVAEAVSFPATIRPQVFVCGSNGFVETAVAAAIGAGLASASIRTERYGG